MGYRLGVGRAHGGELARLQPLINRWRRGTGTGQTVRQQFRLALDEIGEALF